MATPFSWRLLRSWPSTSPCTRSSLMIRLSTSCRSRLLSPPLTCSWSRHRCRCNRSPTSSSSPRPSPASSPSLRRGWARHHLFAQLFKSMTGVEMTHVPYRGSVPALTDVAAGHVQLMFCDIPPALGLINEGKVRALGVSTKERVAALPDLASLAEQGLADFDAASWQMVVAPAATPKDIVERLHAEIKDFMVQPETKDHAFKMGLLPIDTPSVASLRADRDHAMGQSRGTGRNRRLAMRRRTQRSSRIGRDARRARAVRTGAPQ